MSLHNDTVINIDSTEIQTVLTGTQEIKMPLIDSTTSDTTVQRVNLDGYEFTGIVSCNVRGDAQLIIDIQTGITYELLPVKVDTTRAINIAPATEKKELEELSTTTTEDLWSDVTRTRP